jgi:hypothetical protein
LPYRQIPSILPSLKYAYNIKDNNFVCITFHIGKGKEIPSQAVTGPEGSRRLRLPDFMTIGT